ncbi:MAG: hypothetical protein HY774_16465, partial [Acidobacteria bacterium]|nr:hypothetical protein [Acidobacteriota bacterium]
MFGSSGTSVRLYRRRLPVMFLAVLLASLQLSMGLPWRVLADSTDETAKPNSTAPPTPKVVTVNRTLTAFDPWPTYPSYSAKPTVDELSRVKVLAEPFVYIGKVDPESAKLTAENAALAEATTQFLSRQNLDDTSALVEFVKTHPDSGWNASVQLNLGLFYRQTGYFLKAMDAWESAWTLSKAETLERPRAVADRAVAELASLNARLGRYDRLEKLFQEVGSRNLLGAAAQKFNNAKEGLGLMNLTPGTSFLCGPYALNKVRGLQNPSDKLNPKIIAMRSTRQGTSLAQLVKMAEDIKMGYQPAKREPGSEVMFPAIVHWKAGHFAAVVGQTQLKSGVVRYKIADPTFGEDFWVSKEALDQEGSGYFLAPGGELPSGWKPISKDEAATVWGKGAADDHDPNPYRCDSDKTGDDCPGGCEDSTGMATYAFHTMLVNLNIKDTPVGYRPPVGPGVSFTVTYNQREYFQPSVFTYSNLGRNWTHNWFAYVEDDPTNPSTDVGVYLRGGGRAIHKFNTTTQDFDPEEYDQSKLVRISSSSYERRNRDGSKDVYSASDGSTTAPRKIFLIQHVDPQGDTVSLNYDGSLRLREIQDTIGQVTTLSYDHLTDPLKITKVTDPFGRFALFDYNPSNQLYSIEDVISLTSKFAYGTNDFITSMTTPYGTTTFETGSADPAYGSNRWLMATDPYGDAERLESLRDADGLYTETDPFPLPTGMLAASSHQYRGSFYFNKSTWGRYRFDYNRAIHTQWGHKTDAPFYTSGYKLSEKRPFEGRVWYNYPGQTSNGFQGTVARPSKIGRVLDHNPLSTTDRTQLTRMEYNSFGQVTSMIDPFNNVQQSANTQGRKTINIYASNGIDLVEVRQTTEGAAAGVYDVIAKYQYNSQHLPTSSTGADGKTTTYTYNARGQVLTVTNAKNETTTYAYDTNGYLTGVTGPVSGATTTYTYDGYGRVRTVTDSDGFTTTTDYDAMDRPTRITYPDTTYEEMTYDKLDLFKSRDRLGRITEMTYDALRRVVSVKDPLNRTTTFNWCNCGGLYQMTDAKGQVTTWNRDIIGRVVSKVQDGGGTIDYEYDTAGRLKKTTDIQNQETTFLYYPDNNIYRVSYAFTSNATPAVTYNYSTRYNRVTSMTDTLGNDYAYFYHPVATTTPSLGANQLSREVTPNGTLEFTYDELGRMLTKEVEGVTETMTYDTLGRVTNMSNALGAFGYAYDGVTRRLTQITYPNTQTTTFSYFGNSNDRRLQTILNKKGAATIHSQFDYTYNPFGEITSMQKNGFANSDSMTYDAAGQLKTYSKATSGGGSTAYTFNYDLAANRNQEIIGATTTNFTFNNRNELLTRKVGTAPQTNYGYDANGCLINDGTRTFGWDGAQRLVEIEEGTNRVEFVYDGIGRRIKKISKQGSTVVREQRYIWCGAEICWERTTIPGVNPITKRFFSQGVKTNSTVNYYTRDHLGSVREVTDSSGNVVSRYDYDP